MVARVIDALSDRLADRIAKRVVSQLYFRELHPSTLLQREAQAEAAAYVKEQMPGALYFMEREPLLRYAVDQVTRPGLMLELGVFSGKSIWVIAQRTPRVVHGFDSFEGLPEEVGPWTKADFDLGGRIPSIDDPRVRFYKGWFSDVLPHYQVPAHDVLVMNMDADIYSSTAYVLRHFRPWIKQGTYIYFDEFNHVDQEPRAFHELIESGFRFRLVSTDSTLAFSCFQCTQTAS